MSENFDRWRETKLRQPPLLAPDDSISVTLKLDPVFNDTDAKVRVVGVAWRCIVEVVDE